MRIGSAAVAALAILIALTCTATAGAVTCSYPGSAYSTGKPWDVSSPGPQPVNDPVFPDQWGLTQIKAPAAWAHGYRGTNVKIAVVDTGVDLVHPDLRSKIVPGKDFNPAATQGCPGSQDENGHGTHVAGIAAAVTNNGRGVAGTAPGAKVMPVRVLDADGSGDDPTVIKGIKYAADHGAKVINLSLGGDPLIGEAPPLNADIANAVGYAYGRGSLVVAAAGNESLPLCSYPAAAGRAVCVGATDKRGLPSFYSNFPNSPEGAVGVRAPGGAGDPLFCESPEDIWSTIWPGGDICRDGSQGDLSGYDTLAGTSMATPFVTGVAALLAGKGLSNGQIVACLKRTSSNHGSFDPVMGYGIVDANAATSQCSRSNTPAAGGGSSVGGLTVTVQRTTRKRLARKRKLHVTIQSGRSVTVKLRTVARKSKKAKFRTIARKRVKLTKAGKRKTTVRLSRKAARFLKRHRKASFKVLWSGGGKHGVARVR